MLVVTWNVVVGQPHNLHTFWSVCQQLVKGLYSGLFQHYKVAAKAIFKIFIEKCIYLFQLVLV